MLSIPKCQPLVNDMILNLKLCISIHKGEGSVFFLLVWLFLEALKTNSPLPLLLYNVSTVYPA